jgi:MtN3 and saliva related transmembrane protein
MNILSNLATISGIVGGLANIPQIYKIFKNKSAKDLSPITQFLFLIISIIWILYGIDISNYPIIITNSIWILTYIAIIIGFIKYGR